MHKSQNETAKNVLDTQQESASENEESDSVTDQSSSVSEHVAAQRRHNNSNAAKVPAPPKTTQFSVQRSDADGLRMRISAIRPAPFKAATAQYNLENTSATKQKSPQAVTGDKINNNVESVKIKISNKQTQQTQQKEQQPTGTTSNIKSSSTATSNINSNRKMSVDAVASVAPSNHKTNVTSNSAATSLVSNTVTAPTPTTTTNNSDSITAIGLPLVLLPQAPCLSDATESGCSEATTTTIAASMGKTAKKIKVKRKKAQQKSSSVAKKTNKKLRTQAAFSSDSDDDKPLKSQLPQQQQQPQQKQQQQQQQLTQRAPRLLLTAINMKSGSCAALKTLQSLSNTLAGTAPHGSDNIGLSSSDNELPDLVSAAIKRVESDTDDTCDTGGFRKARSKNLPQYQSTLLQDFMEKTQMLGQARETAELKAPSSCAETPERVMKATRAELLATAATNNNNNSNSQTESVASSSGTVKKRRGRPKKVVATTQTAAVVSAQTAAAISASHINESADSGVISTTSTTQSTSPSPKMPTANAANIKLTASPSSTQTQQPRRAETPATPETSRSPSKGAANEANSTTSGKPKIDIAYLDKRMYATERVLYPPPRNKRRQSLSVAQKPASSSDKQCSSSSTVSAAKLTKDELQLDPVWRKIDVNKKFRRPSVSGYKSDGGTGNTTICSKILAAKSGYVSDYGSCHPRSHHHHHNSGYKSDASGKSRYSTKSCMSRRSRAKSCGYRSDCKESVLSATAGSTLKSTKYRRKRRCSLLKTHSKSVGNLNDEQDILQLAGLSLGQSSEESNEYVCKPSLEQLPTTSVSKKYGEINRYIATGEYFGRGSNHATFAGLHNKRLYEEGGGSQDSYATNSSFIRKLLLQRKNSCAVSDLAQQLLPQPSRKIKSRRSSVASYCSSHYSGTSRVKRRRRHRSFRFPNTSKAATIDSKLLTEIEIITSTFAARCRIQNSLVAATACSSSGSGSVATATSLNFGEKSTASGKEKLHAEAGKLLQGLSGTTNSGAAGIGVGKREARDKRALKKRKMSESLDFAFLSAAAASSVSGSLLSGSGSTKRRHKKASSSSPDDHKLPLKKRHYLLTPGEKSNEAAVAAKLFGSNEAWVSATSKTNTTSKSQQQIGGKTSKAGLTPKKRHLLQNTTHLEDGASSVKGSNSSPLRIVIETNTISGNKLLDISPMSLSGGGGSSSNTKQPSDVVHKKRSRLEGLVSKIANHSDEQLKETTVNKHSNKSVSTPQMDSETSCPPPGVFEPSVELEIQIPPIAKLNEVTSSIITKSEVDSPLLLEPNKTSSPFTTTSSNASTKTESTRVVEALLDKTGGNLLLKRKRKKINRTGFPSVRRKKRKINELLLDVTPDIVEQVQQVTAVIQTKERTEKVSSAAPTSTTVNAASGKACDRVPQAGETSATFLERANRTPRLSVVALERLQGTPTLQLHNKVPKEKIGPLSTNGRQKRRLLGKEQLVREVQLEPEVQAEPKLPQPHLTTPQVPKNTRAKLLRTEAAADTPINVPISSTRLARGRKPTLKVMEAVEQSAAKKQAIKEQAKAPAAVAIATGKVGKSDQMEKLDKMSKMQKLDKIQKSNLVVKLQKIERIQKVEKADKIANLEKIQKMDKMQKANKIEKLDKTQKFDKAEKLDKIPKFEKADKAEKFDKMQKFNKADNTAKLDKMEKMQKYEKSQSLLMPSPMVKKQLITKTDKPAFTKSSVQKIITAKSLEAKVKLPAGIDPNTNFSCKIRLKRRSALQPMLSAAVNNVVTSSNNNKQSCSGSNSNNNKNFSSINNKETPPLSLEEVAAEAAAKDALSEHLEHDVLPLSDVNVCNDSEASYDTGDEKSSCASTATTATTTTTLRRVARCRKNYMPAGLFSTYFKNEHSKSAAQLKRSSTYIKDDMAVTSSFTTEAFVAPTSLLPPPPYCEKYFRRTEIDFMLPYDIWWAYKNAKLPSRITVPSWNYRKIRTNVYAESVRPNMAGFDHPTCNCKSDMGCGDNCLNRMVYTECSPSSCPTRDSCTNQKIQRHEVAPGVERFMTENKGWGVRTKLPITRGTYILEYVGEVVTEREFKDRMGTLYLNDIHHYCLHLDGGLVIDGHRMGSDGRFVNHSCQPNCEMQKWSVNGLSRMALFAKRNIEDGEELTYDYNFSLFNPSEGQPCRCNTPQCRGVIGGKSQRVKPLPLETKPTEPSPKEVRNGRQRKRKARKNTQRLLSKEVIVARVQQLTEKEKKLVKQHGVFLVRNFEKIRRCKAKRKANLGDVKPNSTSVSASASAPASPVIVGTPVVISNRRPSTPSSLAVQISALCSPRNIKTRGLTLAVQDPEVEKMAKMAVILRDICAALETLKDANDAKVALISVALNNCCSSVATTAGGGGIAAIGNKKKKALKPLQKQEHLDLKTVQANIEQGYYKQPAELDADMQKIFAEAKQAHKGDRTKQKALTALIKAYEVKKEASYKQLLDLVGVEEALASFRTKPSEDVKVVDATNAVGESGSANTKEAAMPAASKSLGAASLTLKNAAPIEDIIRCICGLYKDEGLMIQCAGCMVWQHTECTKADVKAENYQCERCEPREVNPEIPLEDFTDEGHRYYLSLLRGDLHVRQGDAVYVLRDIPMKDSAGKVLPSKKHTYDTIGYIDYNECDIFRVERLWKNVQGKRFIFGHHFLRPHETFHEPSRRFYPNEVVRVPLYEVVPIELVIGRCWVLDRTTFCKGRPTECKDEEHCYICELRVDKTARFFSKAKMNYPTCTKSYAFRKFPEKLKIAKTYAPHAVDPAMLKTKKQKSDTTEAAAIVGTVTSNAIATPTSSFAARQEQSKMPHTTRKRPNSNSPAIVHLISPVPPTVQTVKSKRAHLENVLKTMKLKWKNTQLVNEPIIDLSYLLSGRGARQRKTFTAATATTTVSSSTVSVPV